MIISPEEMKKRLSNPMNLLNKKKSGSAGAMSLFIKPSSVPAPVSPVIKGDTPAISLPEKPASESATEIVNGNEEVKSEEILSDLDSRLKLTIAHDHALDTMTSAIERVRNNIYEVNVEKLPNIIMAMGKVVTEIRKEKLEREKANKGTDVHHHFYMPEQRKIESYEVIEVTS